MARRIPTNPRYAGVKAVTDTGASLSKHVEKINEIKANFKYRKDELFKRMKISTLVQLMVQVAEFNYDFPPEELPSTQQEEMETVRSTMQSVISGEGEKSIRDRAAAGLPSGCDQPRLRSPPLKPALEVPYLLLDVREADAFAKCHVISSLNYPSSRLARVMNFETPELMAYKNKEGRIIVIYDEEEKLAPRVAQTFVERGYENLFLLSGGMKVALQLFPIGLFVGQPPSHLLPNGKGGGGGGGAAARSTHSAPTALRNSSSNASLGGSSSSSSFNGANSNNHNNHGRNNNKNHHNDGYDDDDYDVPLGMNGLSLTADDDNEDVDRDRLTLRDLNALKMALEAGSSAASSSAAPKTGRIATAASVGKEQRAMANAKMTARKEKLVGGKEWK